MEFLSLHPGKNPEDTKSLGSTTNDDYRTSGTTRVSSVETVESSHRVRQGRMSEVRTGGE